MYYKDITLTGPQAAIGYEDENLPTRVIIDISDLTKYGTGTTVLEVKRPCDREAYIAEQTEVDGNNFYWYPTKGDLEVSGLLKCQVKAVIGDQIVKTRVYFVQVNGALNGDGTLSGVVPDALQTFVESVSGSEDAAKASAEEAKKAEEAAKASGTAAKKSETNAKASETAAKASETAAASSASAASESASSASSSKTAAASSAEAANSSETAAATSASAASKSATDAAASQKAAADSASAASASQSAASKSEANAEASRKAAASSASDSADSAAAAKASETAAAKSASDADASAQVASAATTSAKNAATSESNAKTYASNASDSAMSAALSAASIKASADQMEQYRQETETVSNNLTTEITNRKNADTTLQSQINQIIAPSGEAPSAAEVENARIGADGVTYDTLGNAIRGQFTDLKNAIHLQEINYSSFINDTEQHYYITKRQFYPEIVPKNSNIRTASIPIRNVGGGAILNAEVWEINDDNTLRRVKKVSATPISQTTNVIDIAYQTANKQCYVAIYMYNCHAYNIVDSTKTVYYDPENNVDATTLSISSLGTTGGQSMTGGITFTTVTLESEKEYRIPVKWRQGTMTNGNAYFTMNGCITDYMIPTSICDELRPLTNTHTLSINYYDYADGVYSFSNRVQFTGNHIIDKAHDYFVVNIFKSWSVQTLISECDSIIGLYVTLPITEYTKSIIESGYHNVPQINKNDIWSMAHQGYSADGANHNKKGGYARAASRGFTHGECDVRLTSDGVPVCCHDGTFTDATTGETVTISSKTYAELATYNYYGSTIATLEEIIAECKQCGLQLEIDQMSSSNITEVTDVVSKLSAWDICIFAVNWTNQYPDLAPSVANGIKSHNPNARFLVGYNGFSNYDAAIEFTKTLNNPVFAVGQYRYSDLNTLKAIATDLAGRARLHIWTVDSIRDIKNALPYINGWTSNAISGDDIFNPSKGSGLKL